jgi:hypothetical protein
MTVGDEKSRFTRACRKQSDFRKQTIMTFRTLLLENALTSFMVLLLGQLTTPVSLDSILKILFERSGARMETASQIVYWVNTAGVSVPYRRLLAEVVAGLCTMDLRERGKPIRVHLKDMPPECGSRYGQIACPFFSKAVRSPYEIAIFSKTTSHWSNAQVLGYFAGFCQPCLHIMLHLIRDAA